MCVRLCGLGVWNILDVILIWTSYVGSADIFHSQTNALPRSHPPAQFFAILHGSEEAGEREHMLGVRTCLVIVSKWLTGGQYQR